VERRCLVGRAREAQGGDRQAATLGLGCGGGDGTWIGRGALPADAVGASEEVLECLAGDRGATALRVCLQRRRVAVGRHGDDGGLGRREQRRCKDSRLESAEEGWRSVRVWQTKAVRAALELCNAERAVRGRRATREGA
jgi:hypothetical protein